MRPRRLSHSAWGRISQPIAANITKAGTWEVCTSVVAGISRLFVIIIKLGRNPDLAGEQLLHETALLGAEDIDALIDQFDIRVRLGKDFPNLALV